MFAERLDEIMKIAGVSNTMTGRALAISGAHIGRLRNGSRMLPKEHNFLSPLCEYLAQHIVKDHQLTALINLTGMNSATASDTKSMAHFLENWLQEQVGVKTTAGRFISGFSYFTGVTATTGVAPNDNKVRDDRAFYYYGNAGKRRAVERFFRAILQEKEPQTLLLFSDETFSWLYEDMAFAKQWFSLFAAILKRGNRVKIIHTISRDINEMIEGLTKWIPIYMTGAIEPYYYPRLRDGVSHRTLFIAPKTAAISASSVHNNVNDTLNFFITDKTAISALAEEYDQFFSLCKPLMKIFTLQKADGFIHEIEAIGNTVSDCIISCTMPLLFSMPEALAKEITKQKNTPAFYNLWHKSLLAFQRNIKKQHITEIILSPEVARLHPNTLLLPMGNMVLPGGFCYSEEQYFTHLAGIDRLQKRYDNFTVIKINELPTNVLIYHKEDVSAIVAKTNEPSTAFVFNEQNMVSALGDYLKK